MTVPTATAQLFADLQADRTKAADALDSFSLRGIKTVITDLTQGEAHFVYELLQNADDAQATEIRFQLLPDGLAVWHNAPNRFTLSNVATEPEDAGTPQLGHINAITSIGNSTKRRSDNPAGADTIGRFGIGFKSIFQYTNTPHFYEAQFKFRIERILVPVLLSDMEALPAGINAPGIDETLLWIPFNHHERSADDAYLHVLGRLSSLRLPLLFLRHLKSISWEVSPAASAAPSHTGFYRRQNISALGTLPGDITAEYVELAEEKFVPDGEERGLHRFVRVKQPCHEYTNLMVCLAFPLRDDGSLDPTADEQGYEAFCYFNTRHRTGLRFIIQAPWLLTNNRESIKADQVWNRQLVQQLAQLLADSLPLLRELRPLPRPGIEPATANSLLTDEMLLVLPLSEIADREQALNDSLSRQQVLSFRPFHAAVFQALRKGQFLPSSTGEFVSPDQAYFAENQALSRVFGPNQLRQLVNASQAAWVFDSVSGQNNKLQIDYIGRLLTTSRRLETRDVANKLTKSFMEAQSDEWLTSFYTYLTDARGPGFLLDGQLRYQGAILRLEDNTHAAPYNSAKDTILRVHLPPSDQVDVQAGARTLKRSFAQDEALVDFRRRLNLTEPKLLTVLLDYVLPLYGGLVSVPLTEHLQHIRQVVTCWSESTPLEQAELQSRLKSLPFVWATTTPSSESALASYCQPGDVYFPSADLLTYFVSGEAQFIVESAYAEVLQVNGPTLRTIWQELGVASMPRVIELTNQPITDADHAELWKVRSTWTDDQQVTNHDLDGLTALLAQPVVSFAQSISLFKFLSQHAEQWNTRLFERRYTFAYYGPHPVISASKALIQLKQATWLYDQAGQLHLPHTLAADEVELATAYELDAPGAERALKQLGVFTKRQKVLDGLSSGEKDIIRLYREMLRRGASDEEIKRTISHLAPPLEIVPSPAETPPATPADQDRQQVWQGQQQTSSAPGAGVEQAYSDSSSTSEDEPGSVDVSDPNELSWASAEKLRRAERQLAALQDELYRQQKLVQVATDTTPHTYGWFLALLELETMLNNRKDEKNGALSISFSQLGPDPHAPHLLLLREPADYIPRHIEDNPQLELWIYPYDNRKPRQVAIEVVSVSDFTVSVKLLGEDVASIIPNEIKRASIQIKTPHFLLDKLMQQFSQLANPPHSFLPEHNLRERLPKNLRFIFGPPGTGKTFHLAHNEIEHLINGSEPVRILVLTPTNKAADVLTARLLPPAADATLPPVRPDWLVRYGQTSDGNLQDVPDLVRDQYSTWSEELGHCTLITTTARFPYATCDGGALRLADLDWDYIIFDEASMIPLYQAVNVIYQQPRCREFIIGGDPLQLPPVVFAEPWAGQNIYSFVELHGFANPTTKPHPYPVTCLSLQRRATPPLGRLFSQYAYAGKLRNARPLLGQQVAEDGIMYDGRRDIPLGSLTLGDITIVRLPVRKGQGIFEAQKLEQGSNIHAYSALLAAELALYLAAQLTSDPQPEQPPFRVGIISPYAAQAALTRELVKQMPNAELIVNSNEDIGTVHGFQGDECNIIIVLLCAPPTTGAGIMLNLPHLLNVAVSRARDRLILFTPQYEDDRAQGRGLEQLDRLLLIAKTENEGQVVDLTAAELEQQLFGEDSPDFILRNSFASSHQLVNVYGQGITRYELRFGSNAVDVQVNLSAAKAESSTLISGL